MNGDEPALLTGSESPEGPPLPAPAARPAPERYAADGSCAHPDLDPFDRCRLCGLEVERP